jgi:hypothetical protein
LTDNNEDSFVFALDRKSGVPRKQVKYTEQYAIEEIKRFSTAFPQKKLTGTLYENWPARDGVRHSLANVFGGWGKLMQAAKIPNDRYLEKSITDDDCIEYYEKVWRWKKSQPSSTDLKIYGQEHPMISPISSFTYGRRWGGLRRFAKLFVSYKNEKITKSELINKKTNKKKRKPISNRVRATVLNRDKKTCQDCGKTVADGVTLEVHHIIPWSQGGGNSIDNLITNCFDCNNGKSDKVLD